MTELLLWLHILAAAAWFGTGVASSIGDRLISSETAEARAAWYRVILRFGQLVYTPAAVLVLITGVLLVVDIPAYGFGSTFVSIGFVAVIVGAGLGMAVFGPKSREAAAALDNGDTTGAATAIARIRQASLVDLLVLTVTIAAMVWNWGA